MKLETLYQKEVNNFCLQQPMPDGHDIFRLAQEAEQKNNKETSKIVHFPMEERKGSLKGRLAVVLVAILVMLLGTTAVAAASGVLSFSEMFKKFFKDETTAKLIDEGFYDELTVGMSADNVRVEMLGISGDETHAQIMYNVYVDDPRVTEIFDRIRVEAFVLETAVYENFQDDYATVSAYGTRDEEDHSLYHVISPGYAQWLMPGDTYVYAIKSIYYGNENRSESDWLRQKLDMEFRLTATFGTLAPILTEYYNEPVIHYNGIDYKLRRAEFGEYTCFISFVFNYADNPLVEGLTDEWEIDDVLTQNFREMYEELFLEADGAVSSIIDPHKIGIYYDEEIEPGRHTAYVWCEYPPIDFVACDSVSLVFRDQRIDLTDTDDDPDYFHY